MRVPAPGKLSARFSKEAVRRRKRRGSLIRWLVVLLIILIVIILIFFFFLPKFIRPSTPKPISSPSPPPAWVVTLVKDYFPVYKFSRGEAWFPCSFYFDGDDDTSNNAANYEGMAPKPPYYAYVHVSEYDWDSGRRLMIQYWLYYAYNELNLMGWNADIHHHDWESVFIIFDRGDLSSPIEAVYNRHYFHPKVPWGNVEKAGGSHPVVYVANCTHASYEHPSSVLWPDIWELGGPELKLEDFKGIYIAYTCTGEIPQDHNVFCRLSSYLLMGSPQWERPDHSWPKNYEGFAARMGELPSCPWHREWWFGFPKDWTGNLLQVIAGSPVDLHVWDPLGRHVGMNYATGKVEIEIPDATFRSDGIQEIVIPNPLDGEYIVKIIGREKGEYTIAMRRAIEDRVVSSHYDWGTIEKGEEKEYRIIPSMASLDLTSYPWEAGVRAVINLTNVGVRNISQVNLTHLIYPLASKGEIEAYVLIDGVPYMITNGVDVSVEKEFLNVRIDFLQGIRLLGQNKETLIVHALKPGWSLVVAHDLLIRKEGDYETSLLVDVLGIVGPDMTTGQRLTLKAVWSASTGYKPSVAWP